ncbi:MAG: urease accessory protein UreD [Roseiflexaceae bacterium]
MGSQLVTQNSKLKTQNIWRQAGRLDLALERIGATTRPVRSEARPPLQLSRVRYDAIEQPGAAAFTLMHLGGILEGDSYDLRVALGPGASASVATAAATQVYRMPHGTARQEITLRLAAGSRLAWLPEPLILCAGARFSQTTQVELAPGALLGLLDVLVPGRLARGEVNQFERYEMRLEVCAPDNRCLVAERALLEPQRRDIATVGVLGRTPVLGSLYVLGDGVDADYWCARINQCDQRDIAGTPLPNGSGLLIRMLGATPSTMHTQLRDL